MMPLRCKAAIGDGVGGFHIGEIEVRDPAADEVLVKIRASGLCHTDHDSLNWGKRLVLGHEGAGTVVKVGAGVQGFATGDAVILSWATHCGGCYQCDRGNVHICERDSPVTAGQVAFNPGQASRGGTTLDGMPIERSFNLGTLAEYTLVKAAAVVRSRSARLGFPAASIIGCGVMTGFGSVVNVAKVNPGASVAVLGAGGVGLNVIQGARISGASKIIAIDINTGRLAMARTFGATHTIAADERDVGLLKAAGEVKRLTDGRGADYAFECTAIPGLGAAPLAMVRNAGMAVQVSGIEQEIAFDMSLFEWDKVYINPLYGKCNPQVDFPKIMALYESGELLLDELVTRTYSLENLAHAMRDMLHGANAKGVVVF